MIWWVQPLITSAGILTAACISLSAIIVNRNTARKRATLDLIERSESNDYYKSISSTFSKIRKDKAFDRLKSPQNESDWTDRRNVLDHLTHYEVVALGCQQNILDEEFYKSYMRSAFVRDFIAAQDFIEHIRTPTEDSGKNITTKRAFSSFEILALKWKDEIEAEARS